MIAVYSNHSVTMKNVFKTIVLFAAAATALTACVKNDAVKENGTQVSFTATSESTRSTFGTPTGDTYPTLWTNGQQVSISLNYGGSNAATVATTDGTSATFTASLTGSAPYVYYSVSPYAAAVSFSSSYKSATINIPASQTPLTNSPDEAAQISLAQSSSYDAAPTDVSLNFTHMTAYGRMSIVGLSLGTATVNSISLTASSDIVGRFFYYFEGNGTNSAGDIVANSASKTLTLTTSNLSDIWFGCAPVDLSGGSLTVVVTTTAGTYTKVIDLTGKTLKFQRGRISSFSIDMTDIPLVSQVIYTKVTDANTLAAGDEVIIAASGSASALGTTQKRNNRIAVAVTKSSDGSQILDPSSSVQILTLAGSGSEEYPWALNVGTAGHLYCVYKQNCLRTTTNALDATSSWKIVIDSETGVATISVSMTSGQTTETRSIKRNSNQALFSAYKSGQLDVAIYKKN